MKTLSVASAIAVTGLAADITAGSNNNIAVTGVDAQTQLLSVAMPTSTLPGGAGRDVSCAMRKWTGASAKAALGGASGASMVGTKVYKCDASNSGFNAVAS